MGPPWRLNETLRDVAVSQNVVTILIAHRLSTIMHAERMFVIERGHIVESGAHAVLRDVRPADRRAPVGARCSARATARDSGPVTRTCVKIQYQHEPGRFSRR